jgi:hypothetical protein
LFVSGKLVLPQKTFQEDYSQFWGSLEVYIIAPGCEGVDISKQILTKEK